MAKIVKEQSYGFSPDRCLETLGELLPDLGVKIVSSDAGSMTIAGSFRGTTSTTDPTERDLPLRCECAAAGAGQASVRLVYHNRGQMDRFVSPDVRTKMESVFTALDSRLRGLPAAPPVPAASGEAAKAGTLDGGAPAFAAKLHGQGLSATQIESRLIKEGLSTESVGAAMKEVAALRAAEGRAAGTRNMVIGGLLCAVGIIVTIVTLAAATARGGYYVVAWGAILFGAAQFIRGVQQHGGKLGK